MAPIWTVYATPTPNVPRTTKQTYKTNSTMVELPAETYHEAVQKAIEYTMSDYGPLTVNEILQLMKDDEIAFQVVGQNNYAVPIDVVTRVLQHNQKFRRGGSGRWHLEG